MKHTIRSYFVVLFILSLLSACQETSLNSPPTPTLQTFTTQVTTLAKNSPTQPLTKTPSITRTPIQTTPTKQILVFPAGGFSFEVPNDFGKFYYDLSDYSAYIEDYHGLYISIFAEPIDQSLSIQEMALLRIRTWKLQGGFDLLHGPSYPVTIDGLAGIEMNLGGTANQYGDIEYYQGSLTVIKRGAGKYFTVYCIVKLNGNPQRWDNYGKVIYLSILNTIKFDQNKQ
jgi:hypothetical protein